MICQRDDQTLNEIVQNVDLYCKFQQSLQLIQHSLHRMVRIHRLLDDINLYEIPPASVFEACLYEP